MASAKDLSVKKYGNPVAAAVVWLRLLLASAARGDVFQWQWVDPNDHSLGKVQSAVLCTGGAGVTAGPGSVLGALDLTQAYLFARDLSFSTWTGTTVNDGYFAGANLNQMLLQQCSLRNADFTGVLGMGQFRFCDVTGADFTDAKLKHFAFSTLDNANFTRADLSSASFEQGSLHAADFTDANITGTQFIGVQGFTQEQLHSTASFKNGNLQGLSFGNFHADLSGWDFRGGVDLSNANFTSVTLINARFDGATLTLADFLNANIASANFSGAKMQYAYFAGAAAQNASFKDADLSYANLSADVHGADFSNAIVLGTDFSYTTLVGFHATQLYSTASYQAHDLRGTKLDHNDMTGWSFHGIDLSGANLQANILVNADFSDADLGSANLISARMHDADLTNTSFLGADLARADLRGARSAVLTGAARLLATIMPDGTIDGFGQTSGILRIANYHGSPAIPVRIKGSVSRPARFFFLFDTDPWQSTIGFDSGIPVDVTNTSIVLDFDTGVDPGALLGRAIRVFDWSGVTPIGQFDLSSLALSGYQWDTSRLYSDGIVTLTAVPEPMFSVRLLTASVLILMRSRRRGTCRWLEFGDRMS
ncbi:MAG TPA: pentapeptide repeat-containing protein [Tepidisphaeraceae bacterium]|jgi:uncharacterized protein YjbI with pentapeptide repeats